MFQGSMVALVTPMKADNTLDWDALHKLVDWHLQEAPRLGSHGYHRRIPTLDYKEHMDVVAAVVDQVNGRVPVIAGTGSNSTAEAIELTQAAKDLKADGCLLITLLQPPQPGACICTTKPLPRRWPSANSLQRARSHRRGYDFCDRGALSPSAQYCRHQRSHRRFKPHHSYERNLSGELRALIR